MINDLIVFVGLTVSWCLGFYLITSKGYLLYFLRKPFDKKRNVTGVPESISETLASNGVTEYMIPRIISAPFLTCIGCMASVHGGLMFCVLAKNSVIKLDLIVLILGMVIASFIQTFVWNLFEKISK